MYDSFMQELGALGSTDLAAHELDSTFFRADPDYRGNIYFQTKEGTPFLANFIAEVGSQDQGTWLAPYPMKTPFNLVSFHRLEITHSGQPWTDANAKSHRMILALRCPTGAPVELRNHFRNGASVCDSLRGSDEKLEAENGELRFVSIFVYHVSFIVYVSCRNSSSQRQ
jgi:hypothetical protein